MASLTSLMMLLRMRANPDCTMPAMMFDYEALMKNYDINLESEGIEYLESLVDYDLKPKNLFDNVNGLNAPEPEDLPEEN